MSTTPTIGLVGLGAMGLHVGRNLLKSGFVVVGYDLRNEALTAFVQAGGQRADSLADLGARCTHIILFVVNAQQARAVLQGQDDAPGVLATLRQGVIVLCTTVLPQDAQDLGALAMQHGVQLLDCPVSGGTAGAEAGTLTIMAAGARAAYDQTTPIFQSFGQNLYYLGEALGLGSTMKMVNQLLVGIHIAAAGEAMAFGVQAGIAPELIYDIVTRSAGNSWAFEDRVPRILQGAYTPPSSAVDIFVKDLGIVLDSARQMPFPLPLASSAHQQFLAASAAGWGQQDDSSVVRVYAKLARLSLPD